MGPICEHVHTALFLHSARASTLAASLRHRFFFFRAQIRDMHCSARACAPRALRACARAAGVGHVRAARDAPAAAARPKPTLSRGPFRTPSLVPSLSRTPAPSDVRRLGHLQTPAQLASAVAARTRKRSPSPGRSSVAATDSESVRLISPGHRWPGPGHPRRGRSRPRGGTGPADHPSKSPRVQAVQRAAVITPDIASATVAAAAARGAPSEPVGSGYFGRIRDRSGPGPGRGAGGGGRRATLRQ